MKPLAEISVATASLLVGLLAIASPARAQDPTGAAATTWSVDVSGPCAEVPGFASGVGAAIPEGAQATRSEAEMRVSVATTLGPPAVATLEVFDALLDAPAGERTIESDEPGCAKLQRQLVVVLAILVEAGRGAKPTAAEPPEEPEPEPESGDDTLPVPTEVPPNSPEPEPAPTRKTYSRVRVGPKRTHVLELVGTGGFGQLPHGYPGAELRWSVTSKRGLPVRFAGAFAGPSYRTLDPGRVRFSLGYASLGVCPEWPIGRISLGFCGLVGLGSTRGESLGLPSNRRKRAVLVVVGAEGSMVVPLAGPVALVLGMQALVQPSMTRFVYFEQDGDTRTAYQPSPVAIRGHGGLRLRFR